MQYYRTIQSNEEDYFWERNKFIHRKKNKISANTNYTGKLSQ